MEQNLDFLTHKVYAMYLTYASDDNISNFMPSVSGIDAHNERERERDKET